MLICLIVMFLISTYVLRSLSICRHIIVYMTSILRHIVSSVNKTRTNTFKFKLLTFHDVQLLYYLRKKKSTNKTGYWKFELHVKIFCLLRYIIFKLDWNNTGTVCAVGPLSQREVILKMKCQFNAEEVETTNHHQLTVSIWQTKVAKYEWFWQLEFFIIVKKGQHKA